MSDALSAARVVELLGLTPLMPEGGHVAQTWRDTCSSAIYYLMTRPDFSGLHRLEHPEIWAHHLGPVAELLVPGRELAARKWERWQGCVTQSRLTARAPARGARQGVVVAPSDGFSPPPRGGRTAGSARPARYSRPSR